MAEFLWVESSSTALTEEPRLAATQYGDGYAETAPDGLNPITQKWSMRFRGVDDMEADSMVAFLRGQVSPITGYVPFDWFPKWAAAAIKVKCVRWSRTLAGSHESDIDCEFEQVHLP